MITNFALSLTFDRISLLQRADETWLTVGEVSLDAPDLPAELADLRARALELASDGLRCKIIIPDAQIRYLRLQNVPKGGERRAARAALEGATPYAVEQLNFDCYRAGNGQLCVAAVAHETLDEAEAFAIEHGFDPYSFVATPDPTTGYKTEPYLGTSLYARDVMPKGAEVTRDRVQTHSTGVVPVSAEVPITTGMDKIPLPTFDEPEAVSVDAPTDPPVSNAAISETVIASEAPAADVAPIVSSEPEAPFVEVDAPSGSARPSPEQFSDTLRAHRKPPRPSAKAKPLRAERAKDSAGVFSVIGGLIASTRLPLFQNREPAKLGRTATAVAAVLVAAVATAAVMLPGDAPEEVAENTAEPAVIPVVLPETLPDADTDASEPPATQLALVEDPTVPPADAPLATPEPEISAAPVEEPIDQPPVNTTAAPTADQLDEELALLGDATDLLPEPEPVLPKPLSKEEALAHYARTGISVTSPTPPTFSSDFSDSDVYIPSQDSEVVSLDAVALPRARDLALDELPPRQSLPADAEHQFSLDENGLVTPTPEGTLAPGGYRVFLGTPDLVPPDLARTDTAEPAEPSETELALDTYKLRPKARPEDLVEGSERSLLGGLTLAELASRRPKARPNDLVAAFLPAQTDENTAAAVMDALRQASGGSTAGILNAPAAAPAQDEALATASLVPKARPENLVPEQKTQRVASVAATTTPRTTAPKIPSNASVSKAATEQNALNLRKIALIGVFGSDSSPRALVRLPNGRYKKVQIGDKLDGGKVAAISSDSVRLVKGGRNVVLSMPNG